MDGSSVDFSECYILSGVILLGKIRNVLDRLAQDRPEEQRSIPFGRIDIICWWERRRFAYNILVGIVGVASWFSVLIFGSLAVKPGVDFEEPIGMVLGPFLWAFVANVCYTSGWMLDTTAYKGEPRRKLFKIGLTFCLTLTALPGLRAVLAWNITLATG